MMAVRSALSTWTIDATNSIQEAHKFHESLSHRLGDQLHTLAVARQDAAMAARIRRLLKTGTFRWTTPAHAWLSFRGLERPRVSPAQLEERLALLERSAQRTVPLP